MHQTLEPKDFKSNSTLSTVLKTIVILAILIGGFYAANSYLYNQNQSNSGADGYKNAEYIIDGNHVRLENGRAQTEAAPGSAVKIITQYFGNDLKIDLNGDGEKDVVFLLTQNTGGSGTYYYVVAALRNSKQNIKQNNESDGKSKEGWIGSESYFLGDRIAPQTIDDGGNRGGGNIIIVNYADRATGESFAVQPSVGKSVWLILDLATMQFATVQPNFEGESAEVAVSRCDFGASCDEFVKTYLEKNIAKLSPEKEVLGGKFLITNFTRDEYTIKNDAISDSFVKGTVSYSDGHNEFTARYSFKINPNMSLTYRTLEIMQ